MCFDGTKRLCHIRGKMRKKVWVNLGDFQDEKADVILKYTAEEARNLKTYGELPDNVKINETDLVDGDLSDDGVEFDDDADAVGLVDGVELDDI